MRARVLVRACIRMNKCNRLVRELLPGTLAVTTHTAPTGAVHVHSSVCVLLLLNFTVRAALHALSNSYLN